MSSEPDQEKNLREADPGACNRNSFLLSCRGGGENWRTGVRQDRGEACLSTPCEASKRLAIVASPFLCSLEVKIYRQWFLIVSKYVLI